MCTAGQFDLGLHRGQRCCDGVPEYNICAEFVNFSALSRAQLTDRGGVSPSLFVFVKMGSTSWRDNIQQALLIGLVVQIVVSILSAFCAFLRASWKKQMARPPTVESMAESDVEMGTVNINVGEGATIPDNPPHDLAANPGFGDDGKLEDTEDTADTRANTPEIPAVDHLPKAQWRNVTEDVKRSFCACCDEYFTHPANRGAGPTGSLICKSLLQPPRLPNAQYSCNSFEFTENMSKSACPN